MAIDTRADPRVCQACLGFRGSRIEPCGVCERRAALEQRADRAAQAWRANQTAPDLGELLADFAECEALPLDQAKKSIIAALIGSCECNTKSPDAAHHLGYCRYLKLLTALDCLDAAPTRS